MFYHKTTIGHRCLLFEHGSQYKTQRASGPIHVHFTYYTVDIVPIVFCYINVILQVVETPQKMYISVYPSSIISVLG